MNLKTFQGYLGSRGYKVLDKNAYGVETEYPAAIQFISNKQWKVILSAPVVEWKALVKDMKSELGKKYYFMYENGHLCYTLTLKDADFQQVFQERPAVSFPPMVPDRFAGPGIHPQPDRKYDGKQLLRLVFSSKKTVDPGRLRLKTAAAAFPDPEKDRQGHFIRTGVLIDMPKNFQKTSDIAFKILLRV